MKDYGYSKDLHTEGEPDTKTFTVKAERGLLTNGIISNPFIEKNFRTESYEITVNINDGGTWSYDQDTVVIIPNYSEPFHHRKSNRLTQIGEHTPNLAMLADMEDAINERNLHRTLD